MIRRFVLGLASAAMFSAAMAAGPALADDVTGTWLRETGLSKVKFAPTLSGSSPARIRRPRSGSGCSST